MKFIRVNKPNIVPLDDNTTRAWVGSTLKNDEESSDAGLADYFMHGGLTREQALKAVSQRDDCLNNLDYEVEL